MKVQLNNKDNIFILLRIVISLGTAHLEWKKKSSRLVDMLGTVIMRKKRTAVCSRFQSQFRPLTSEIGKAEQCPAMRKDHPVSDFKKKSTQSPCCLQRAISMVWIVKIIQPSSSKKKKQSCAHHHRLARKGDEGKGLIWKRKKENYLLRRCRNTHPCCLTQERRTGAECIYARTSFYLQHYPSQGKTTSWRETKQKEMESNINPAYPMQ